MGQSFGKKNRIEWIDIAKFCSIILMIVGHTVNFGSLTRNVIFSFHMPLFIILSGYTFRVDNDKIKLFDLTKKDIKRLLFPVFITCILKIMIQFYYSGFDSGVLKELIVKELQALFWASGVSVYNFPALGALWCLCSLFWVRLIVRVVNCFFKFDSSIYFLCGMGFGGVLLGNTHFLPQNFDVILSMLIFFAVGMLWKKYEVIINKFQMFIFFISLIIWSLCLYNGIYIEMASRTYPLGLVCFLEACCGTFIVCKISDGISEIKCLNKTFSIIGKGTLLILCIHHLDWFVHSIWLQNSMLLTCVLRVLVNLIIFVVLLLLKNLLSYNKKKSLV